MEFELHDIQVTSDNVNGSIAAKASAQLVTAKGARAITAGSGATAAAVRGGMTAANVELLAAERLIGVALKAVRSEAG